MRNDQIFVLLLIVLLPLSGCFDNSVGDAEGATEGSSTVVNHYYNNTTTTVIHETPVLRHITTNSTSDIAFQIAIAADEALEIVSVEHFTVWNDSVSNNNAQRYTYLVIHNISCFDGSEYPHYSIQFGYLWRGVGECIYTFGTSNGIDNFGNAHHSVLYKIHPLG